MRSSSRQPHRDQALTHGGVLRVAWARVEQFIELAEQGPERVAGSDDHDRRMVLAEPAQTEHLIVFVGTSRSLRAACSSTACLPALTAVAQR
jgi:hypothetical protein